jgi:hypothetical protein
MCGSGLDAPHVGGLGSPNALHDVELDPLPLLQRAGCVVHNGVEMHKDVRAVAIRGRFWTG